jgi:hypothetical protein
MPVELWAPVVVYIMVSFVIASSFMCIGRLASSSIHVRAVQHASTQERQYKWSTALACVQKLDPVTSASTRIGKCATVYCIRARSARPLAHKYNARAHKHAPTNARTCTHTRTRTAAIRFESAEACDLHLL